MTRDDAPQPPLWMIAARVVAGFLGGFCLLNLAGELWRPGFDANGWWVDPRALPPGPAKALLLAGAPGLLGFALSPPRRSWGRRIAAASILPLLAVALANTWTFYRLHGNGLNAMPLPLSLLVALGLGGACAALLRYPAGRLAFKGRVFAALAAGLCLLGFPLAQMFCFGKTDYRRPAEAIVVPGARAYADGTASQALADRVRTACALFRGGLAPRLLFSGGPGDGPVSEPGAMRALALREGVPEEAILLDEGGLSTRATVADTAALLRHRGLRRVLVVSHFYHLPRLKLAYQRAGLEVWTVPARETRTLAAIPLFLLRETAAWWVYYLWPPDAG